MSVEWPQRITSAGTYGAPASVERVPSPHQELAELAVAGTRYLVISGAYAPRISRWLRSRSCVASRLQYLDDHTRDEDATVAPTSHLLKDAFVGESGHSTVGSAIAHL